MPSRLSKSKTSTKSQINALSQFVMVGTSKMAAKQSTSQMRQYESSDFDTDEPTLEGIDDPSLIGEFTEQLSDCSKHDNVQGTTKFGQIITVLGHLTGGLYHADAPNYQENPKQIRQRQVFIECMQIVADFRWITLYMFFALSCVMIITTNIKFYDLSIQYANAYSKHDFCIYDWAEWSPCSATCSTDDVPAQRYRRVKANTVIDMREIPPDMAGIHIPHRVLKSLGNSDCFDIIQYAPCNVYKCPKPLANFTDWGPCEYAQVELENSNVKICARFREIDELALVEITDDVPPLFEMCDCKDAIVPW
uniref:CW domain-containing protein n=1 Tax=Panagrellus redivivus TaxID=6233 RepID=A0A7E4US00_PANRE